MLGASCHIEVSKMVLIKCRNPEETEDGTVSASSKDASSSGVLMELARIESRPYSKSSKRSYPHIVIQVGSRLVLTPCPLKLGNV